MFGGLDELWTFEAKQGDQSRRELTRGDRAERERPRHTLPIKIEFLIRVDRHGYILPYWARLVLAEVVAMEIAVSAAGCHLGWVSLASDSRARSPPPSVRPRSRWPPFPFLLFV